MALSKTVSGVFVVAAKRTAFGTYGGKLKNVSDTELAVHAAKGALESANIAPDLINSMIIGNTNVVTSAGSYMARHIGLKVGLPISVPAMAVNRICGSGFQAMIQGSQEIELGLSQMVLVGGTESMSQAPFAVRDIRFGIHLGQDVKLSDTMLEVMFDTYIDQSMALTAENLGQQYGISRLDCDNHALQTQTRWQQAHKEGKFDDEIVPITIQGKKGPEDFAMDEHPRSVTAESLARLRPAFKKDGKITAGNACGISDGAAALVLASESAVKANKLTPLARLSGYGIAGCDPKIMGIGPAVSSRAALKAVGKSVQDMDVVEVNEAFAPQFLAVAKELGLDPAKTNVNGGAIALGHPIGATGARIATNLVHEIRRSNLKTAMGSACIGGGQGVTVLLEKP